MSVNKKRRLEQSGSILSFIKIKKREDESQTTSTQPSCSKSVTPFSANVHTNRNDTALQPCLTTMPESESSRSSHLPNDIGNFIVKQVRSF